MDSTPRQVDAEKEIATGRCGDWMQTVSGRAFWPLDPRPEDISIRDIAHALGMICRFGGHTKRFYSVAEHSWHVSHIVPPEHALSGLLHDATEAYIGDMIRPLKNQVQQFADVEDNVWSAICVKFHLPYGMDPSIKAADNAILLTERDQLLAKPPIPWHWAEGLTPAPRKLHCWTPSEAAPMFLKRFRELTE